jgi:hypothetical protein
VIESLRFAAAFWLLYAPLALHPAFNRGVLAGLWQHLPQLAVAALVGEMLPFLVGLCCLARWLRAREAGRHGAFAVATRTATVLAILGLLLPFHAEEAADPSGAIAYRAGLLLALLLTIDGPFVPDAGRTAQGSARPGSSSVGNRPSSRTNARPGASL